MACADAAQHPGNDYYVNDLTGTIQRASGFTGWLYRNDPAWSGPYDWCQAKDHAGSATVSGAIHSPGKVASHLLGGLAGWVLRIAEIVLGTGLIIVAVAKLASGTSAGRAAMKAGKAAAIL
ncbi:MAG TPA: hypothetical protein VKU39_11235 [Streptosporangiaceae bacterium]|nr:hypothetical protein [Streptosporangiaceae bacterium]